MNNWGKTHIIWVLVVVAIILTVGSIWVAEVK